MSFQPPQQPPTQSQFGYTPFSNQNQTNGESPQKFNTQQSQQQYGTTLPQAQFSNNVQQQQFPPYNYQPDNTGISGQIGFPPRVPTMTMGNPPFLTGTKSPQEIQLRKKIEELEEEILALKENAEEEARAQEKKRKQLTNFHQTEIDNLNEVLSQMQSELADVEEKQRLERRRNKKKIDEMAGEVQLLLNQIDELEENQDAKRTTLQIENRKIARERIQQEMLQNQKFIISDDDQQTLQIKQLKDDIQKQKQKIQEYELKLNIFLYTQAQYDEKVRENDKEHQNFLDARDEITALQRQISNLKKEISMKDSQQDTMVQVLQGKTGELNAALLDIKKLTFQLQQKEAELSATSEITQILERALKNPKPFDQKQITIIFQDVDNRKNNQKEEEEKKRKEVELQFQKEEKELKERQQLVQLRMIKQQQQLKEKKENALKQFSSNMNQAKQAQGQLDVCFLVDVTGSMDSYKEQTKKCITGSLQAIKQGTNRDTHWSSICYQDIAELKKLGKYYQFDFSQDTAKLSDWFDTIKCSGGGDGPEDIRGAIKQMCKLNWPHRYKIAILICDAPCHGKRYVGRGGDDYPDDDIQDAIELMIQQEIFFIGLNFTDYTVKMYEEIKKIYIEKKREDLLLFSDLRNLQLDTAAAQMSKWIGEASKNATQTNKNSTKSKKQEEVVERPKVKDGAMEALCKSNDFMNFEKNDKIKIVDVKFKVLKVEIKEDAFEKNITNIFQIKAPQDYQISEEGVWDCIRTDKPFAFGMMKDVFLMKKKNQQQNELYVIKTPIGSEPYKSRNDAVSECRSHLLCQRLMKKFRNDLESAVQAKQLQIKVPQVIYSDFLILEETNTQYWIAERFFKGDFVKYNNNYGFINDELGDLNKFAQAFSYYTYFTSDFTYMVSDVQGVGIYFTDPAINTNKGDFDDTDMGMEGQQMYLVNYENKKAVLTKDLLDLLDIYE